MANIGKVIGDNYKTLMPDFTDDANIQDALQMYHYGQANYDPNAATVANSIEGHFADLQDQVDDLFLRPGGGGEVKTTEPVVTPTGQPIPDGYVWVDKDDISLTYPEFPTVLYSPTQPTGLGIGDVGTIWVDSDSSVDVLSLTDYQPITKYTSNAPLTPITGQLWMDSDDNVLYLYNGTVWIDATSLLNKTFTNGTFSGSITNNATITGGTLSGSITNNATINGGTIVGANSRIGTSTPTITANAYTLATNLSDAGKLLELSNSVAMTLTVPNESTANYPVGTQITLVQTGAGQVTVSGAGGVTVNGTPGLKTRAQWSLAVLTKRSTANTWLLTGDLVL